MITKILSKKLNLNAVLNNCAKRKNSQKYTFWDIDGLIGAILKNINWGYVQISGQIGVWSLWMCQKSKDMPILH
jgi:hypothetical protein